LICVPAPASLYSPGKIAMVLWPQQDRQILAGVFPPSLSMRILKKCTSAGNHLPLPNPQHVFFSFHALHVATARRETTRRRKKIRTLTM
jgi:hypothetical protein